MQRSRKARYLLVAALLIAGAVAILSVSSTGRSSARATFGVAADLADDVQDWIQDRFEERFDDPKTSPFEEVTWADGEPRVKIADTWYTLEAVDGWPAEDLLAFITREHGAQRLEKRFEEDLPQVLREGWKRPGGDVLLKLRAADGTVIEKTVTMTEANRRRHWEKRGPAAPAGPVPDASAVLGEVAAILKTRHSYTVLHGLDDQLLTQLKSELPPAPTIEQLAASAMRLVAESGDGHASVEGGGYPDTDPWIDALFLPLAHEPNSPAVAVKPDRTGFIDPARPRVLAIDGVPLEEWIAIAQREIPRASPQLVRDRALRTLRSAPRLRSDLALPPSKPTLTLTLAHIDGSDPADSELPVVNRKPIFGTWPRTTSRWLPSAPGAPRIGYVRIAEMGGDRAAIKSLSTELRTLGQDAALILDLRGNAGGMRDPIHTLADFLLPQGSPPLVYNIARPLLLPGESPAKLRERMSSRFLYPADSPHWTQAQRSAITAFASTFNPEIACPEDRFGPWHYALVTKSTKDAAYTGRVVVLMDERCFSAADVCLAALREIGRARTAAGLPGITLMGQPSAGGSGLAQKVTTADGRLTLRLSSMVSFMPNGQLFDGRGVPPDVLVAPTPTDFVVKNGVSPESGDSILDAALQLISARP